LKGDAKSEGGRRRVLLSKENNERTSEKGWHVCAAASQVIIPLNFSCHRGKSSQISLCLACLPWPTHFLDDEERGPESYALSFQHPMTQPAGGWSTVILSGICAPAESHVRRAGAGLAVWRFHASPAKV